MTGVVLGTTPSANPGPEPEVPGSLTVDQLEAMGLVVLALDPDMADELHQWLEWLAYQPSIYMPIAARNIRVAVDPYADAQADKAPVRYAYGGDADGGTSAG